MKIGDFVLFANSIYEVADIKEFPFIGQMIGIYDEPPSKRIDYLRPSSVKKIRLCSDCQREGCPTCNGFGYTIENEAKQ